MEKLFLVLSALLIIGAVFIGGCSATETTTPDLETPTQIIKNVTPQEAFTLIQNNKNNPDFVILDVRTP